MLFNMTDTNKWKNVVTWILKLTVPSFLVLSLLFINSLIDNLFDKLVILVGSEVERQAWKSETRRWLIRGALITLSVGAISAVFRIIWHVIRK
jgi:hypothetical protein